MCWNLLHKMNAGLTLRLLLSLALPFPALQRRALGAHSAGKPALMLPQ